MKIFKVLGRFIFSRITLTIALLLLQIIIICLLFSYGKHIVWIYGSFTLISIIIVLFIVNSKRNPSYKIAWIIPLLLFPGFGILLYTLYKLQFSIRIMRKKLIEESKISSQYLIQDKVLLKQIKDKSLYNLATYVNRVSNYKIHEIEDIKYYNSGISLYNELLNEIKNAKKYIFLEFFIIDKGYMLNTLIEILKKKITEGVEVRIMYDGMGSLFTMHQDFYNELNSYGIKCKIFSPLKPIFSFHYNYRDHRKLCIIDGNIAYTGGFNIADEYINKKTRFGYWKDGGIKITGDVVNSYIVMFLELWNIDNKKHEYNYYINSIEKSNNNNNNGYVIGYGSNPLDDNQLGKRIYLDIINNAKEYIYIMSPYLILDDEMLSSLTYASLRGVDVKIFMPSIPDKKYVYYLGRSFYEELIESGIEIYEYKPGFNHSKMFLSDDIKAVIGTINLDYRSLYLHFECGCYIYDNNVIKDIKKDFITTMKYSNLILKKNLKNYSLKKRIIGRLLRFLAPLM